MDKLVYRTFWAAEAALFLLILWGGLHAFASPDQELFLPGALDRFRYAAVLLSLAFALLQQSPFWQTLLLAASADCFLIFSSHYLPGILLFLLVQETFRQVLRLSLSCLLGWGTAFLFLFASASYLFAFPLTLVGTTSAFYAGVLLRNLAAACQAPSPHRRPRGASHGDRRGCSRARSATRAKKEPGRRTLAYSLTLLTLCDFHVALGQLPLSQLPGLPLWLALWVRLSPVLIWIFYLPAQVLLASIPPASRAQAFLPQAMGRRVPSAEPR